MTTSPMNEPDMVRDFLDDLRTRLDRGAVEYGNQSLARPVSETVREILEEQVDQVGWCYVLWCQASRKTNDWPRQEELLRGFFLQALERRIRNGDRMTIAAARSAKACMLELEVLALDLFLQNQELRRRLIPIARAVEVAPIAPPPVYGRRGSIVDPRSSD